MRTIGRLSCESTSVYCPATALISGSRHNDQVVVYDHQSKQLGVRDVASQRALDLTECPYCHQSLRKEDRARSADNGAQRPNGPGFVSPGYFRMLRESLPGSAESSAPPSPRRRLVEPVRAPSGSVSDSYTAEYIHNPPQVETKSQGISASAFSQGYFHRFFVTEKELGRGGKGVVLLVTHVLDNVDLGQYACKRVPVGNDHQWLIQVLNEVRLLEHLSHQHLVYYKHVWLEDVKISKFGPSVPCAFILQQYCNAGDLHQYIVGEVQRQSSPESAQTLKERARRWSKAHPEPPKEFQGRKLRLEEIYSFFKDITSGLNHLHLNGFIHRDLKPSNCLLHDAGKGLRVLVSDFGEVQVENMVRKSTGATGTVSYCAPEVLRRSSTTGQLGQFSTKSDIFSLGMILYFLCFARLPYRNADYLNEENEDLDQLREEIITWGGLREERKLRPDLPEQLYTFLRRLLSLNPEDRPSGEEILLGIKTGSGLDEISDNRPNASAHVFDDLGASSRISPVDSPRPSTPATGVVGAGGSGPGLGTRKGSSASSGPATGSTISAANAVATSATGFKRPSMSAIGPTKLRMSSFQRDRSSRPASPSSSASSSELPSPSSSPSTIKRKKSSFANGHTSEQPEGQLIVLPSHSHSHPPSPSSPHSTYTYSHTHTTTNTTTAPPPRKTPREILAPPPPLLPPPHPQPHPQTASLLRPRFLLQTPPTLTLALLVGKLISLHYFCTPLAANSAIVYPLLGVAILDAFVVRRTPGLQQPQQQGEGRVGGIVPEWTSLMLAALHAVVMAWASRRGCLCEDGIISGGR